MPQNYFTHDTAIVDQPVTIGADTKIWHWVHIMSGAEIGSRCVLGQNVYIAADVRLGNNVKVQNNVSIYDGVTIEDDVFCGPSMVFTNVINPRSHVDRRDAYAKTVVKKGASIGANATIICGNTIGSYAFIAAGAVITHDVPAYALMVGVPAKQMGWVSRAGARLDFTQSEVAVCAETKERYRLEDGSVFYVR